MSDLREERVRVATAMRELGHAFAAYEADEATLSEMKVNLDEMLAALARSPERERTWRRSSELHEDPRDQIPQYGSPERTQFFTDSVVSGAASPMGLGALLSRDGEQSVMEVTLGKAFEGASGLAHGGMLAALIDETMGLSLTLTGVIGLTAQLDMSYRAPTPILQPLVSRAWVARHEGRKVYVEGTITCNGVTTVEAKGLFITVDFDKVSAGR